MSALTEELHQVSQELEGSRSSLDNLDSQITRREKILKDRGITLRRSEDSSDGSLIVSRSPCFYITNLLLLLIAVAFLIYVLTAMVEDQPTMLVL